MFRGAMYIFQDRTSDIPTQLLALPFMLSLETR